MNRSNGKIEKESANNSRNSQRSQNNISSSSKSNSKGRRIKKENTTKPISGYLLFCKDYREQITKENAGAQPHVIMSKLGQKWREDATTKAVYNKKALDMKNITQDSGKGSKVSAEEHQREKRKESSKKRPKSRKSKRTESIDESSLTESTHQSVSKDINPINKNKITTKLDCGLCGKTRKLTKTDCCNQPICDDEDKYEMFSFSRVSCHRNHDRYTLCSYHHNNSHEGDWQTCEKCKEDIEAEMINWYGTNDYNFVKMKNPPSFVPHKCVRCGHEINMGEESHMGFGDKLVCCNCLGF